MNEMTFQQRVMYLISTVTSTRAYFFHGTLFLETEDSKIAGRVFSVLHSDLGCGIIYGKCGQSETSYDFV